MEGQTLLEQHHARKTIVKIPEVHTADPALVISAFEILARKTLVTVPKRGFSIIPSFSCYEPTVQAEGNHGTPNRQAHLQFTINVNSLAHPDLQASDPLARLHTPFLSFPFIDWRVELITPRTPPAVAVAVVVT